ncbi:MAG: dethiobiotin synthase [Candidatus Omnitrophica bacterium]|nr:dethiobiotin synthase [Candidatus Omnitrophota bacterium]
MKTQSIFIAGTDTGIGKTIVTGLMAEFFLRCGYKIITQKWIQTGIDSDIDEHIRLMKKNRKNLIQHVSLMCPYHFQFPSSPHLAASIEKRTISKEKIKQSFWTLKKDFESILVEATGGILVPLSGSLFMIDIVKELSLPVVLVAGNKLGTINHTLLSIEALKKRKIRILGIIFNNLEKKTDLRILEDNPVILNKITGEKILGVLPWTKDINLLYRKFIPIGNKLDKHISQ